MGDITFNKPMFLVEVDKDTTTIWRLDNKGKKIPKYKYVFSHTNNTSVEIDMDMTYQSFDNANVYAPIKGLQKKGWKIVGGEV